MIPSIAAYIYIYIDIQLHLIECNTGGLFCSVIHIVNLHCVLQYLYNPVKMLEDEFHRMEMEFRCSKSLKIKMAAVLTIKEGEDCLARRHDLGTLPDCERIEN